MKSKALFGFLDEFLAHEGFPDDGRALNGLQVEGPAEVERVAAAVDGTLETIDAAVAQGADLLLVHHGIFWDGFRAATGRRYRRLAAAIRGDLAIYASHLPLDAHPEVGNGVLLAGALGLEEIEAWGDYEGRRLGARGSARLDRAELVGRLERAVAGPVEVVPGGPERVERVAVVTGSAATYVAAAAADGVDALVTGEAPHHAFHDARELGVNLLLGGHYATECFGVRALAEVIESRFGIPWSFIDRPTGF